MSLALFERSHEWKVEASDFFGVTVHVATKVGDNSPSAVTRESIVSALEESAKNKTLQGFLGNNSFESTINYDGAIMLCQLVSIPSFIRYCALNSSPKLDKFRDYLVKVMESVHKTGTYKEEAGSFMDTLSEAQRANPTLVALMSAADAQQRLDQLNKDVKAIQGQVGTMDRRLTEDVKALKGIVKYQQDHWTVSSWLDAHKVRLPNNDVTNEGKKCRAIADKIGVIVPERKVYMGDTRGSRQWPREVINLWWPDFCRRHDIPLFWNV